jgi:hypothetical protein
MRTFEIPIDAPKISGTYETIWRIATSVNGIRRCFGPKITVVLSIMPTQKKQESRKTSNELHLFCT